MLFSTPLKYFRHANIMLLCEFPQGYVSADIFNFYKAPIMLTHIFIIQGSHEKYTNITLI